MCVRSGDTLCVWLTLKGDEVADLCLETVVRFVYTGTLRPELLARALDPNRVEREGVEKLIQ